MHLTPAAVTAQREWVDRRASVVVPLLNETREELGAAFDVEVATVDVSEYHEAVEAVFADGDRAVNVAALVGLLRDLDVVDDYPGFVVDELLGRELAGLIAGPQPLRLLAEATFHVADVYHHGEGAAATGGASGQTTDATESPVAGLDDLDAALAAGFQTRLPGWDWRTTPSPFDRE